MRTVATGRSPPREMTPVTQPSLGILMLNTRFPRPPGDIGNPETWPFPVLYQVIEAATVDRVVNAGLRPRAWIDTNDR